MLTYLAQVDIGDKFKFRDKGVEKVFPDLASLINVLLPNIYVLAGLILLLLLIFGGITIILNAGKGPEEMAKGKGALTAAIIGFVLIFISYWVINIISYLVPVGEKIFK